MRVCRMSRVAQVAMVSSGNTMLENYTIGDVLICKAHRGKLQEIAYLIENLQADINYCNQVTHTERENVESFF